MQLSNFIHLDKTYSWHPFTQMKDWCADTYEPLILKEGEGAILRDIDGREYIDGNSSIWTNLHGHRHPIINKAIHDQLSQVAHVSYLGTGNVPAALLAEKLVKLFPPNSLTRVFFSDNGSTAIEVAIKMAAQFWQLAGQPQRYLFVAFDHAYHGDTMGAASLGGVPLFHDRFSPFHFPAHRVRSVEELASLPELHEKRVAAICIEPIVQGVAGIRIWPEGTLRELRALCDATDTLLIFDEVMTGFGRTGTMFACQHENVLPDFIALAKGLTGGYLPLAATLTTDHVFNQFLGNYEDLKTFFYGHSYTANPLGCAAALANLKIFEQEQTLTQLENKIAILNTQLTRLLNEPHIGEIRQCGFITGIDIVAQKDSMKPYPWQAQIGAKVCQAARNHGLLTRPIRDTILLIPPYCITPQQISRAVEAIRCAVNEVCTT